VTSMKQDQSETVTHTESVDVLSALSVLGSWSTACSSLLNKMLVSCNILASHDKQCPPFETWFSAEEL
jgi:hypothetical protein